MTGEVCGTRRQTMIGIAALVATPLAAFAGGEGGGNRDAKPSGSGKAPAVMSQDAFLRLHVADVRREKNQASKQGQGFAIQGFSAKMTKSLIKMKAADERALKTLMRDMRGLKTKEARAARLDKEHRKHERRIKVFTEAIEARTGNHDSATQAALREDRERRRRARDYLREVPKWERDPMEGRY